MRIAHKKRAVKPPSKGVGTLFVFAFGVKEGHILFHSLVHGLYLLEGQVVAHIDVVVVAQNELVDDVHLFVQHGKGAVKFLRGACRIGPSLRF